GVAAGEDGTVRRAGELRELRRRHCPDAVTTVVEHEPLLTGDPVAAKTEADLLGQRLDHFGIAHRRRRAQHERPRPGDVASRVGVRPAYVADDAVRRTQLRL